MKKWRVNLLGAIRRSLLTTTLALLSQLAYAQSEYAASWGPDIGSMAPMLSSLDQHDNRQDLETLKGSNGLLFVFNRSVDW